MKTPAAEIFPLPWERRVWSAAPALPVRLIRPRIEYVVTDFRLVVRRGGHTVGEMALDEIQTVTLTETWWQRACGTSTIHVESGRGRRLRFANIRRGSQLALIIQLRAADLFAEEDARAFETPAPSDARSGLLWAAATAAFALLAVAGGIARQDSLPRVVYGGDDPIAPHGHRRPTSEIAAFMEREVMPFARVALGPFVGGADAVTCETCHGRDAEAREWRMPGVRALPEPALRFAGLERAGRSLDPQMRNAVYGYLAEEDNQTVAAYMRREVMPGMARVMKRPAYDFAKSYGYNRSLRAVGCYHCHLVE